MDFLNNLPAYEDAIYLFSALGSLIFALVLFSFFQRAISEQEKRWAIPFALTFWVLAALYFVLLIIRRVYGTTGGDPKDFDWGYLILLSLIPCFSALTNYLFLVSGSRLREFDKQDFIRVGKKSFGTDHLKVVLVVGLILAAVLQIARLVWGLGRWADYPDNLFSIFALLYLGLALYNNIRSRREKLQGWEKVVTWLGLVSFAGYAAIYFLWGLGTLGDIVRNYLQGNLSAMLLLAGPTVGVVKHMFREELAKPDLIASLLVSLISLPFKFLIFYFGYSLLLLLSGPLQGIEGLLKDITRGEKELLDSDGILMSVWKEVHAQRAALYIKLPGAEENQIELHEYPLKNQGPLRFLFQPEELYGKVMKSEITKIILADPTEPTQKQSKIKLVTGVLKWPARKPSKVGVPVLFHGSVIACLEVSIGKGKFSKADRAKLERIATLIAPALQAYREMSAINKITDDAGRLQIEVQNYDMKRDVDAITRIIHNVISPLTTGVSIELGFERYERIEPANSPLKEPARKRLGAKDGDKVVEDVRVDRRWLRNELKFMAEEVGKQNLGKFIFATDKVSRKRVQPTLGTNETFLLAVSDLATDTLLDFTRGRLNQLTDSLGKRLSDVGVRTPADWLGQVQKTAQEAKLCWAVVRYKDGEDGILGDEAPVNLIQRLETPDQAIKFVEMEGGFSLYSLDKQEADAYHVIRKSLVDPLREQDDPLATLWLGVGREGFGEELRYTSPWEFFLYHFCEIASSALHRLLEIEKQKKLMGEVQSTIAGTLIVGPVTHSLTTVLRTFISTATRLLGSGMNDSNREALLEKLGKQRDEINSLFRKISDLYKDRDLSIPCPLKEVVERAVERVETYTTEFDLKFDKEDVPPGVLIDVPFEGAVTTLAIVIENAKDAIRGMLGDGVGGKGRIRINVRETEDKVICDIVDNGPGIPARLRGKLLKEVSKSTKPNSHGVGLLFSVHLLRLYNGDIKIKEYGPEPNTTVSIILPKYLSRQ